MPQPQDDIFRLGLTMAGAISAGAYTAGVLDFLFSALKAQDPEGSGIRVVLKAMSGTSAGGVCTALSVPALIEGIRPFDAAAPSVPLLHAIWVRELDFLGGPGRTGLVSQTDLDRARKDPAGAHVYSLLNSEAIEEAASRVLADVAWKGGRYDFVAEELDLFITCTNLAGQPYRIAFNAGDEGDGHLMANHAYVAHFRVDGLGAIPVASHWLDIWKDRGVRLTLDPAAGPGAPQAIDFETAGPWHDLREMGVVTGAFPIGLAAKQVVVSAREFGVFDPDEDDCARGGAWPLEIDPGLRPVAFGQGELVCSQSMSFVGVDGGVCNNEPFELARYALRAPAARPGAAPWELEPNPRAPDRADRAVIMIDPFPEGPQPDMRRELSAADRAILPVVAALKSALLDQARFKPGELVAAMDGAGRSRFLIAPVRDGKRGSEAIASGLLGGFGGFFSEAFREHDFQLGRRNCQWFLQKYFTLEAPHQVFSGFGAGSAAGDRPILALDASLTAEIAEPQWPRLDVSDITTLIEALQARVGRIGGELVRQGFSGKIWKMAVGLLWNAAGRGRIEQLLTRTVGAELIARDQVTELAGRSEAERKVLATLFAPGPDLRTIPGLGAATGLPETDVAHVIARLKSDPRHQNFAIWEGDGIVIDGQRHRTFAIWGFRPRSILLFPGIGGYLQGLAGRISSDMD
ncbi:hypothetical protein [Tropicimonas sp. IMCC34043]|uniref:hypothetical protein n=1 Tax=Tropicimonas sp. IMCC34043 TaxID=2248760 RepID=UPI000E23A9B6|nr:hypothetical protein [Tropicimonas sp. IMCC34043]